VAELAREAKDVGWDGCFVWDDIKVGSRSLTLEHAPRDSAFWVHYVGESSNAQTDAATLPLGEKHG
jgi:hypothetical protein